MDRWRAIVGPLFALWISLYLCHRQVAGTDLIHSNCSGTARQKMYPVPTKQNLDRELFIDSS